MSEKRTVYSIISEYRNQWGFALFTLNLHEIIKLSIQDGDPEYILLHIGLMILIIVLWALSDFIEIDEDARFWK